MKFYLLSLKLSLKISRNLDKILGIQQIHCMGRTAEVLGVKERLEIKFVEIENIGGNESIAARPAQCCHQHWSIVDSRTILL